MERIGAGALKSVMLYSDSITDISWQGFPALETVTLACPNLATLNLSDCDALSESVFKSISDGGRDMVGCFAGHWTPGCPRLRLVADRSNTNL